MLGKARHPVDLLWPEAHARRHLIYFWGSERCVPGFGLLALDYSVCFFNPAAVAEDLPPVVQKRVDVPIVLPGSNHDLAGCTGGEVYNLDPKGDNFLSVLSGPGGPKQGYREIDKIIGTTGSVPVRLSRYVDRHHLSKGPKCSFGWL